MCPVALPCLVCLRDAPNAHRGHVQWLTQLIEPTVLAERHLLGDDDRIRETDFPERMQVKT